MRLNRAASARKPFNSAIAPPADCLVSDATPGSLATCSTALASDEHEPRDSANSPTAFALNSGVYLVPFAMVPSSPIELGEMRNKNQFISKLVELYQRAFGDTASSERIPESEFPLTRDDSMS